MVSLQTPLGPGVLTWRTPSPLIPSDNTKKELITFDTANIVKQKARYVVHCGFGGTMYWDLSSDYVGSGSLVSAAISQFGGLDQTRNHLHYPGSQFDNVRSCMGACPPPTTSTTSKASTTTTATATATTTTATKTTTTTSHTTTTQSSLPSSPCKNLYFWDHDSFYPKGAQVKYGLSATRGQLAQ